MIGARNGVAFVLGLAAIVVTMLVGCATTPHTASGPEQAQVAASGAVGSLEGSSAGSSASGASSKSGGPPEWLTHYPNNADYFIGIGGSADTGSPSSDMAAAEKNARNALASEIATTIKSETSLDTRANAKGDTKQSVTVLINEQVNLKLEGVQLVDSYHSKKMGYWFYYRLPRAALDPRPTIARGVRELFSAAQVPLTVSLGAITYSDTGLSSAFSMYLQDQILLALRGEKGVTISAKVPGSGGAAKVGKQSTGVNGGTQPNSGSKTYPTARSSLPGGLVLTGTFFGGSGDKVSVFLRLTDPIQETVAATSSFTLGASMLPQSLTILPENFATAVAAKEAVAPVGAGKANGLQLQLWPTRGDGATYFDGEDLVLNLSSNRDCYIKMYHIDVNGRVSLILPNRFSQDNYLQVGKVYHIPPQGASYRFQLGKPYGVEFIKVIASTRQFSDIEQAFTDLGPATRSLLTRGLEVKGTGPEETAQAMVSYTILAKGQ